MGTTAWQATKGLPIMANRALVGFGPVSPNAVRIEHVFACGFMFGFDYPLQQQTSADQPFQPHIRPPGSSFADRVRSRAITSAQGPRQIWVSSAACDHCDPQACLILLRNQFART